jgi:hypothetical protein
MKPKSAILMACVGLACGAVGLGLGASWRAANQADPGPRAPRSEDGLRAAQLMLELDAARARASSLQRQIDAMPPAEPSSDAAPEQAERKPAAGDEPDELPVPEGNRGPRAPGAGGAQGPDGTQGARGRGIPGRSGAAPGR